MLDWIREHRDLLWLAGALSVVLLVASVVIIPAIVLRIPADYFAHAKRPPRRWVNRHAAVRITLVVLKNVLGVVLVLAGLAMLMLPGQGVLTIIIGVLLLDGPGKYRFECWLISRPFVLRPINWLRMRSGKPPLQTPGTPQQRTTNH